MPYFCPDWLCTGKREPDACENDCSKCTEPLDCSCIKCQLYEMCYAKEFSNE